MVDLKKALCKKKEEDQEDTVFFDIGGQESGAGEAANPQREGVQSFSVGAGTAPNNPQKDEPQPETAPNPEESKGKKLPSLEEQALVNDQIGDLSSNLKNLVYDFRSFMSEQGSPFNPNDIPANKSESNSSGEDTLTEGGHPGYISIQSTGLGEKEAVENSSQFGSKFEEKLISPQEKLRLGRLLEQPTKSSAALSQLKDALGSIERGTKFSKDLKSNLDATDMPALIRAVNSTDYLLHAVGRSNLLKILEVGTREGWIRPEVERVVLSVAEILSTAGVESENRVVNVNDLLRVVYFLNRLLDPGVSDFLALNSTPHARGLP